MTAAVYDAGAIRARRLELFPPLPEAGPMEAGVDRERLGTLNRHCGVCPEPEDQPCRLNCDFQRRAINDGVTVT